MLCRLEQRNTDHHNHRIELYLDVEVLQDLVQSRLCTEVEDEVRELREDAVLPPAQGALGLLQGLLLLLDGGRGPAHPGAGGLPHLPGPTITLDPMSTSRIEESITWLYKWAVTLTRGGL